MYKMILLQKKEIPFVVRFVLFCTICNSTYHSFKQESQSVILKSTKDLTILLPMVQLTEMDGAVDGNAVENLDGFNDGLDDGSWLGSEDGAADGIEDDSVHGLQVYDSSNNCLLVTMVTILKWSFKRRWYRSSASTSIGTIGTITLAI